MQHNYLHNHPEFSELLRIISREMKIHPYLVEKDYWIMHCLYGLQKLGFEFELKGGTSLSKGYKTIDRFSEDIDIRIEPPKGIDVKTGRNQDKPSQIDSRKNFYDWLANSISIDGILDIQRDKEFDDEKYRSGGIRLNYKSNVEGLSGIKDGVLLEVGFDDITPNILIDISSWAYDYAAGKVDIADNRAIAVPCYHSGYTLVEKIQAISTKYRRQQESGQFPKNFMRHYYDIYCLLAVPEVQKFIGSKEYLEHKNKRFRTADNKDISQNDAFQIKDKNTFDLYAKAYDETSALYYNNRPSFEQIMDRIRKASENL